MRFQLTDDQRALRDGVRDLLAGRFDRDAAAQRRGHARAPGPGAVAGSG